MKLTRYFQSCLLVEESGTRFLIDASGQEAGDIEKFGKVDAVLFTHEHGDHFDTGLAQQFMDNGVPVYANASTAQQMKNQPNIVTDGQEFEVSGLKIQAKELPHCLMPDGTPGPQNTGYLIAGRLFHSGDGTQISGQPAEIVAGPITGPDVSLKDAMDLGKAVSAKIFIPVHYDFIGTKPDTFAYFAKGYNMPFEVRPIAPAETIEI